MASGAQPQAILNDSEKALAMFHDPRRDWDRFGDTVDDINFWVKMVEIMRKELVKALNDA